MAEPTRYQDVISATNYALTAEDGTPFPVFLAFNGSTQFLQTNPIDFSSTDKVLVAAGVRKLSDAATGLLIETSVDTANNSGVFRITAPSSNGAISYNWTTKGSAQADAGTGGITHAAPITNVLSCIGNISGDSAILRVNGAQAASGAADQGTGNYGNYPLYIGARAGTALFFNGRLYSLIIAGIKPTDAQILGVETYINSLTRAF